MRHSSCWILGYGRFGRLARERLHAARPGVHIVAVDHRDVDGHPGVEGVTADAVEFLNQNLRLYPDVWIVPALPMHLAYEWIAGQLNRERRFRPQPVPSGLVPYLPNPFQGPDGQVYLSNADFRCPDDCPEPRSICTCTGKPRPQIMHTFLANLAYGDYTPFVIRSVQLAPGVGGYRTTTLLEGLDRLRQGTGPFLLSTACKCHAVMHAFSLD